MGGDPPNADRTCQGIIAWHIDQGRIDGVDVSGRTFTLLAHIPGNVLKGNWRVLAVVDDRSTVAQEEAIRAKQNFVAYVQTCYGRCLFKIGLSDITSLIDSLGNIRMHAWEAANEQTADKIETMRKSLKAAEPRR